MNAWRWPEQGLSGGRFSYGGKQAKRLKNALVPKIQSALARMHRILSREVLPDDASSFMEQKTSLVGLLRTETDDGAISILEGRRRKIENSALRGVVENIIEETSRASKVHYHTPLLPGLLYVSAAGVQNDFLSQLIKEPPHIHKISEVAETRLPPPDNKEYLSHYDKGMVIVKRLKDASMPLWEYAAVVAELVEKSEIDPEASFELGRKLWEKVRCWRHGNVDSLGQSPKSLPERDYKGYLAALASVRHIIGRSTTIEGRVELKKLDCVAVSEAKAYAAEMSTKMWGFPFDSN